MAEFSFYLSELLPPFLLLQPTARNTPNRSSDISQSPPRHPACVARGVRLWLRPLILLSGFRPQSNNAGEEPSCLRGPRARTQLRSPRLPLVHQQSTPESGPTPPLRPCR